MPTRAGFRLYLAKALHLELYLDFRKGDLVMSDNTIEPIVKQAASLLELVFDEAMRRASERHGQLEALAAGESLWVEGSEAVKIMGAGYTLSRLKQLGHQGVIVMDRKDPDKPNSPYIFLRSSLHDCSVKRVFELDERQARSACRPKRESEVQGD